MVLSKSNNGKAIQVVINESELRQAEKIFRATSARTRAEIYRRALVLGLRAMTAEVASE